MRGRWLIVCAFAGASAVQAQCEALAAMAGDRFADHSDGTLTDKRSGLMWQRCSVGQRWEGGQCLGQAARLDWPSALAAALAVNQSGSQFFNDWRLPQLRELAQLAEPQCANPRISLAAFPATPAAPYWSASARAGDASGQRVYALSFGAEGVLVENKEERLHVRLVRSDR